VIEYHGNSSTLSCLSCGRTYRADEKRSERTPRCECKSILKPDVVFFGEAIPPAALSRSFQLASKAEVLMVVGTSAVVSPANTIPSIAKERGAKLIEINPESTHLTHTVTDIFIGQSAGEAIPELVTNSRGENGAANLCKVQFPCPRFGWGQPFPGAFLCELPERRSLSFRNLQMNDLVLLRRIPGELDLTGDH
jgi:NAD-dependent deacetylase